MVEYIGIAGGGMGGGGEEFDVAAWAPYLGGGFLAIVVLAWLFLKPR